MDSENILHVKFEHDELVRSKKDLLEIQISLLKIAKAMHAFKESRTDEMQTKLLLQKKTKELNSSFKKMKTLSPTLKIPSILKKEEPKIQTKVPLKTTPHAVSSIESELLEIQNRLKDLG